MKNLLISLLFVTLLGCSSQSVYLTPIITGQVIDENTKQPIANKGKIFTIVKEDLSNVAVTDNNGFFHVPAFKSKPLSESVYRSRLPLVTFNIEGYQRLRLDCSSFKDIPERASRDVESKVDVGKVYLKPIE